MASCEGANDIKAKFSAYAGVADTLEEGQQKVKENKAAFCNKFGKCYGSNVQCLEGVESIFKGYYSPSREGKKGNGGRRRRRKSRRKSKRRRTKKKRRRRRRK